MPLVDDRVVMTLSTCLPVAVLAVQFLHAISSELLAHIATCLVAWTCMSVPIGMLIGFCTLSED